MNQPFEVVRKSQINTSKTKEAHAFPKEQRFPISKSQIMMDTHYQVALKTISAEMKKRSKSFSQARRFVYKDDETPRTFQNLQKKQGPRPSNLNKRQQRSFDPGPATYNPKALKETSKFSFGSKLKTPQKQQTAGPGSYSIQKYNSSKKPFTCKIPQSKRFAEKDQRHDFPSPQRYKVEAKKQNSYSFGHEQRVAAMARTNMAPGPGAYSTFSQFSQRKKQLESKLNRLQTLIKQGKNTM